MFLPLIAGVTFNAANEYVTVFRDAANGEAKFHVLSSEIEAEGRKATLLNVQDKKAWLIEDLATGNVTLQIGQEAYTAPKPKEKEPVTSLSYFSKVYANATAPKKKKNLLGGLGGNLLGALTGGLAGNLMGAFSGSLGAMTTQTLAGTALRTIQGVAVQSMTQSLGRATSVAAMSTDSNPYLVQEVTKVDKTTMAETLFLRKSELAATEIPNPTSPKTVTATELYDMFVKFVTSGVPDKEEGEGTP